MHKISQGPLGIMPEPMFFIFKNIKDRFYYKNNLLGISGYLRGLGSSGASKITDFFERFQNIYISYLYLL